MRGGRLNRLRFAVALCAVCAWPSAEASPARRAVHAFLVPPHRISDAAQAERRACLRKAVRDYRRYFGTPQQNIERSVGATALSSQ